MRAVIRQEAELEGGGKDCSAGRCSGSSARPSRLPLLAPAMPSPALPRPAPPCPAAHARAAPPAGGDAEARHHVRVALLVRQGPRRPGAAALLGHAAGHGARRAAVLRRRQGARLHRLRQLQRRRQRMRQRGWPAAAALAVCRADGPRRKAARLPGPWPGLARPAAVAGPAGAAARERGAAPPATTWLRSRRITALVCSARRPAATQ
jgi:hypothetical protein